MLQCGVAVMCCCNRCVAAFVMDVLDLLLCMQGVDGQRRVMEGEKKYTTFKKIHDEMILIFQIISSCIFFRLYF